MVIIGTKKLKLESLKNKKFYKAFTSEMKCFNSTKSFAVGDILYGDTANGWGVYMGDSVSNVLRFNCSIEHPNIICEVVPLTDVKDYKNHEFDAEKVQIVRQLSEEEIISTILNDPKTKPTFAIQSGHYTYEFALKNRNKIIRPTPNLVERLVEHNILSIEQMKTFLPKKLHERMFSQLKEKLNSGNL